MSKFTVRCNKMGCYYWLGGTVMVIDPVPIVGDIQKGTIVIYCYSVYKANNNLFLFTGIPRLYN